MKRKIIIGFIIGIAAMGLIAVSIAKNSGAVPSFGGGKAYSVKVKEIEKSDISSYISASGIVEEIEKAEVYFDMPLKIKEILVEKNQKVQKGQKLIELDTDSLTFELEKLKINKSTQMLALNTVNLDAEIARGENSMKSAERALADSEKNYNKSKELYEAGAIPKSDYEASERALADASAALKTARLAYEAAVESKEMDKGVKELNLKATQLSILELEKKLERINSSMYSPIDGIVAELNVQRGSSTDTMRPAFKLINIDKLQVRAGVREYDIGDLAVGQVVEITGDAIDKDTEVTGKVVSISPSASSNRTSSGEETVVEVIISIDVVTSVLKPGIGVTCDIFTVERKNTIIASMEMIKEDKDGGKAVFVVDQQDYTMHEVPVKLGIASDMHVEILEGLNEGDVVVLDPQPNFQDGARVKILESSIVK